MIKGMNLQPVMPVGVGELGVSPQPPVKDAVSGFGEILNKAVDVVSARQAEANHLSEGLVSGQHANIHETMIAVEKSSISMRLMTKVHQKGLDAYQEMMRMQL
ncbi:flagellar hook-basal body complex protein FliE [Desulfurivibrio alkaliphilus]|uniref:Flagellar hook-basal body complex protein FliE n=1 Tax=Desulfurivibrio alkaliphilus (strain DSM 19089 / UNIQEM U267 / AHT2) TaxID=589865 RepID=D6Z2W1_DESAT|nr:flagellar hook-basal body complex protein FliE [Desulfurivibrio alkaliphilus]ADH85886.1 flagellar hook-basal body complex subunit FliE [Desulfurivibrio alkaliphilus AHT 2]